MNNFGKALYVIWFFFYVIVAVTEIFVLRTNPLGEQKLMMVLGTGILLLCGLVLFLSTIFIVRKKTKWLFGLCFVLALLLTFFFYISLLENALLIA